MKLKAKRGTDVFDKPGGAIIDDLAINAHVESTGETEGLFLQIEDPAGWVKQDDVQPADPDFRLPLDRAFFVEECIKVERDINALSETAPYFVSADFLLARAFIETGLENKTPQLFESDAVGPLQVSSAEWKLFLDNGGSLKGALGPGGNDGWLTQVVGAGWRMHSYAKAMSKLKPAANVGAAKDPFLPSYLDVFHAHILDSPEAAMAIRDAIVTADAKAKPQEAEQDQAKKIDVVLKGTPAAPNLDRLFKQRERFLGTKTAPKSLGDVVKATETALNEALKKAFDLIKELVPEELPKIAQGEAPWYDIAKLELSKDITEADPADKDTILDYFNATDLGRPNSVTTPWCGAFAAHCIAKAGLKEIVPKGAALAANWKKWGSEISFQSGHIPEGAVVVLSPSEGTGTSGHVAFFVRFLDDDKKIELLGGNQSNAVKLTQFSTSRVAAVRWIDLEPDASSQDDGGPPSNTPISQKAIDLIVAAEVTSEALYEKRYRQPTWPKGRSGVTIGIGYDVGCQSKQQVAQDWKGLIPDPMIARLQTACGVTGSGAASLADSLADVDVPFAKAMAMFMGRDVPRWVGIVQRALPNAEELSPSRLGALVSLTYNRGASFSKDGDRYKEMRNIKAHMTNKAFHEIPEEFRNMERLWPDMAGLRQRREDEARLFEIG